VHVANHGIRATKTGGRTNEAKTEEPEALIQDRFCCLDEPSKPIGIRSSKIVSRFD
jgi:hypothetical protein